MHSNIIQISKNPIDRENWVTPSDFYEDTMHFADYIGDTKGERDRKGVIEWMARDFGLFDIDGETLVLKGDSEIDKFIHDWNECIRNLASKLNDKAVDDIALFKVRKATEETHLGVCSRFYIEDWNGYAGTFSELVEYVTKRMKQGDRLYIGAVIDYHF